MPEGYVIGANRKLILSRAWGMFSNEDLQERYRRMTADSAFGSHYAQLADLRLGWRRLRRVSPDVSPSELLKAGGCRAPLSRWSWPRRQSHSESSARRVG